MSLVARYLESHGLPTVVIAAARDIVEQCGVARLLHVDFPLGAPCGEPGDRDQQRAILGLALSLLEEADHAAITRSAPFSWRAGERWKDHVFTAAHPWKTGEDEQDWLRKKALYKQLKSEGKI
ncbi:MAG: hypothetical protein AAF493_22045 [Pseudomonadota bacterium]